MYLPSYSLDYNPIEEAFAKITHLLRKASARTKEALVEAIAAAPSALARAPLGTSGTALPQFAWAHLKAVAMWRRAPQYWRTSSRTSSPASSERFQRMLEHCTQAARKALLQAKDESRRLEHDYTDSGHILLGLLGGNDDPVAEVLRGFDVTLERGREWIENRVGRGPQGKSSSRPQFTLRAKKALELALREAKIIRRERMGTEHILLELLREGEEWAMRMLIDLGVQPGMVRRQLLRMEDADSST